MAYDAHLAERVRAILAALPNVDERVMFGGLAFMLESHMCCGVVGDELMLRLGRAGAAAALEHADVRPMDFTGRVLATMVFVESRALDGDALRDWVDAATTFVRGLPAKR